MYTGDLLLQFAFAGFYETVCGDFALVSALSLRILVFARAPFELHGSLVIELPSAPFLHRCFVRPFIHLEYGVSVLHNVDSNALVFSASIDLVVLVDAALFSQIPAGRSNLAQPLISLD